MITTAAPGASWARARVTAMPSIPPRRRSTSARSGGARLTAATAAPPLAARVTRYPAPSRQTRSIFRMLSSSSTTSTRISPFLLISQPLPSLKAPRDRQRDDEHAPAAHLRTHLYPAPVRLDDLTGQEEAAAACAIEDPA